jgi:hypothetical protein
MKQEDYERLKAVCEKEGFDVELTNSEGKYFFITANKKDPWEGVEFFIHPTGILPLKEVLSDRVISTHKKREDCDYRQFLIKKCKPSTESAYVDQLKKEAFERFREIKEGDRFDVSSLGLGTSINLFKQGINPVFNYDKKEDCFRLGQFRLYQQGQWATKLPKRIKVEWAKTSCDTITFNYGNAEDVNLVKDAPKIASIIEKYLNNK